MFGEVSERGQNDFCVADPGGLDDVYLVDIVTPDAGQDRSLERPGFPTLLDIRRFSRKIKVALRPFPQRHRLWRAKGGKPASKRASDRRAIVFYEHP
ncbi:hypothetical protein D3C86_912260 [compost metagenome]